MGCGLGLIGRGADNGLDLAEASTCLGLSQNFKILFPALESASNKDKLDRP
jgi:hypothetical protein